MKVYIAGPMTGFPAYNLTAFEEAAFAWAADGHEVETPFDANSRVWFKHHGRPFDPHNDTCEWNDPLLREMFAEDVAVLLASDAVALLPGWENSKGATLERTIAERFNIPCVDASRPARSLDGCVRAEAAGVRASA